MMLPGIADDAIAGRAMPSGVIRPLIPIWDHGLDERPRTDGGPEFERIAS
jgi:hypothetical protein